MYLRAAGRRVSDLVLASGLVIVGLSLSATAAEHGGKGMSASGGITASDALDGKVFVGKVGAKGKTKGDKDEFVFKGGTFRSTACDQYGFTAVPYTTTTQGDVVTFDAVAMSPTDGQMVWKGTVKKGTVEGTALWHKKPGATPKEYWFKGSLKP